MRIVRGVAAVLLALVALWCALWLNLFILLSFVTKSGNHLMDFAILGAWVVLLMGAAYLVQPWWRHFWRPAV